MRNEGRRFLTNMDARYADLVRRAAEAAKENVRVGPPRYVNDKSTIGVYGPNCDLGYFWKLFEHAKRSAPLS